MSYGIEANKIIEKKIDFLKSKYGPELIFKCEKGNFYIENVSSEELSTSDFFNYKIEKIVLDSKMINIKKILDKTSQNLYIQNCKFLKKISCDLEGISHFFLTIKRCPRLNEIVRYQKIENLHIDHDNIDQMNEGQI